MTCIVGLVHEGVCWLGGDSAVTKGYEITAMRTAKVFRNGDVLLGVTGSLRMAQITRYTFRPPAANYKDPEHYLATEFLDALRSCYTAGGFIRKNNNLDEIDGAILLGYRGRLFEIGPNLGLLEPERAYHAVGSGAEHAHGALYATEGHPPETRIRLALEAAAAFGLYVKPPFVILRLPEAKPALPVLEVVPVQATNGAHPRLHESEPLA